MLNNFFFSKIYYLEQRFFDLYLGTSTIGIQLTSHDFYRTGSDNWPYQGCDWLAVLRVLRELHPNSDDFFVDLGSGKGKALLIAGHLSYGKVVGVELDPELAAHAKRNLEAARSKLRASRVESQVANALEWPIPKQANTIFMFNPFFGETFRSVIGRIFDSYDENPRRMHIVYQHPWEHNWLVSTGRVVVDNVRPGAWPSRKSWWEDGNVIVTYHVVGAG
jgi:SAM-dependent methyltransferase